MRFRSIGIMVLAIVALALSACGDLGNNNANTNANANASRANANTNANVNVNTNTNTNENANTSRRAPTREEYERDRARYEREAKEAGRTVGTGVNDGWLWVKARYELAAADDLRDSTINVDVNNSVVTLTGTVPTPAQRAKAEQVAKSLDGVKSVKNMLKVAPSGNSNANANKKANK
jgi:hyperosmotically inducible periplasmic protein